MENLKVTAAEGEEIDAEKKVEVNLENKEWRRLPCVICYGWTEKDAICAAYRIDGHRQVVCDECLKEGAAAIPARLLATAARLKKEIRILRTLASYTWILPTYEEKEKLESEFWDSWEEERKRYEKEKRDGWVK